MVLAEGTGAQIMIRDSSFYMTLIERINLGRLEAEYRELLSLRERVRAAEAAVALEPEDQTRGSWERFQRWHNN